jgi:hypothetical protein
MIRSAGLTLVCLTFALGLLARAESQQLQLTVTFHPAAPVHQGFAEQFASGFEPEVDLRPEIKKRGLAIRDQGNRGTCTVFATTFLIEYKKAGTKGTPPGLDLSEEYLNWAGNKVTGEDADGGFFTKFIPGFRTWAIATAKECRTRRLTIPRTRTPPAQRQLLPPKSCSPSGMNSRSLRFGMIRTG